MAYLFVFFLALLLVAGGMAILLSMPAARIAGLIRLIIPVALAVIGGGLALAGRFGLALPLLVFAYTIWLRSRGVRRAATQQAGMRSTVRSAMFEMELDHETGQMDGLILTGHHEGSRLSQLDREALLDLLDETGQDDDSGALLEAYLDRRFPGWREDAQPNAGARQGGTTSSGPMTKEEAYQILGLAPGAGTDEIREAHRRLMKRIHPDSGGSTFLASKINEAKDVLLN